MSGFISHKRSVLFLCDEEVRRIDAYLVATCFSYINLIKKREIKIGELKTKFNKIKKTTAPSCHCRLLPFN